MVDVLLRHNNMKNLTVIIPCFNCAETIEEAVESVYRQNLENLEVILVDDKSTDSTREIIKKLKDKYPEIKIIYHDNNQGGGTTRNTGIASAQADVVFCLDSDDILPPNTLCKMLTLLKEKKCDGVGIHRSIKFRNISTTDIRSIDTFAYEGEEIPFKNLFEQDGLCSLYSTFMHTKRAHEITGGFPTEHGFDTQGFAWRFLMNGLKAYTCPDAEYLHRVEFNTSYYLREYNSGKSSRNWQLILSEFIFMFSPEAQNIILKKYSIWKDEPLIDTLKNITNPWIKDAENIIQSQIKPSISKEIIGRIYNIKNQPQKTYARNSFLGILIRINNKIRLKIRAILNVLRIRSYNPIRIGSFLILLVKKFFKVGFISQPSLEKIDVVIPTISKDLPLLSDVLNSIRLNVKHPINKIFIITQKGSLSQDFCLKNNCTFIDEASILGYGKERILYILNNQDRSGWIFQQLLKLSADSFVEMKNYLVIDSDTILINPHTFIENGKFVFLQSKEWNPPYFKGFKKLFKTKPKTYLSNTAHMMLFNVAYVKEMKKEIENKHHEPWIDVIMSCLSPDGTSSFSEYETYSNWMYIRYPQMVSFLPFYNIGLQRSMLLSQEKLMEIYGEKQKSLSFHHYIH